MSNHLVDLVAKRLKIKYPETDIGSLEGCTEAEIEDVKTAQRVTFLPKEYEQLLRVMGRELSQMFYYEMGYPDLLTNREYANQIINSFQPDFPGHQPLLPEKAFVFSMRQRCGVFDFFYTGDENETPMIYRVSCSPTGYRVSANTTYRYLSVYLTYHMDDYYDLISVYSSERYIS